MVGLQSLDLPIGVRIPVSQPTFPLLSYSRLAGQARLEPEVPASVSTFRCQMAVTPPRVARGEPICAIHAIDALARIPVD